MALTHPARGSLRPVFVTGLGLISAAGADVGAAWAQIATGRPVVKPVQRFDIRGCECRVAAQVDDDDLLQAPPRVRWPRFVRLGPVSYTHLMCIRDRPERAFNKTWSAMPVGKENAATRD